ncbi:MAG TPA: hypothetical protein VF476_17425 [Chitinophagaceae bacterium]
MANKQYISIIRLFDHCGISTGEDFNLARVKKQLQAEFSIAQGGFIEVDGHSYTRHDVFEEIERPDFSNRLVFHKQIWNSKQILQLLENNVISLPTIGAEFKPFWSNPAFDEFFSPYFAGPFNYLSRTFLTEYRLESMGSLLAYEDFLQAGEREEAFRPIRIYLEENMRLLRNVNKENYAIMRPKIAQWIEKDWHLFFNNLPHEFYETKNDIITLLINIGVAVQKTHRKDCAKVSEQLISLHETPESLRKIIVSNHAVYTGSSGDGGSISWRNIFWIGWVVFMLFRAFGSDGCDSSNSNNYRYIPPVQYDNKYKITDSAILRLFDSIRISRDSSSARILPSK